MDLEEVVKHAKKAKDSGASRFCMGAAWRNLNDRDLDKVCDMIKEVNKLGLESCVTLGMINGAQAEKLKDAGLDYYNHNIDSSEEFYKTIITTRKFEDRLNTLKNIEDAKINVCSGGIVGMGESREDRAKMLMILASLPNPPKSVPINMLVKTNNSPLSEAEDIDHFEFIKTIAVARILMPTSAVRLSAGRSEMNEQTQSLCFLAGANSIFYGEKLLTTENPEIKEDKDLFKKVRYSSGLKSLLCSRLYNLDALFFRQLLTPICVYCKKIVRCCLKTKLVQLHEFLLSFNALIEGKLNKYVVTNYYKISSKERRVKNGWWSKKN